MDADPGLVRLVRPLILAAAAQKIGVVCQSEGCGSIPSFPIPHVEGSSRKTLIPFVKGYKNAADLMNHSHSSLNVSNQPECVIFSFKKPPKNNKSSTNVI